MQVDFIYRILISDPLILKLEVKIFKKQGSQNQEVSYISKCEKWLVC